MHSAKDVPGVLPDGLAIVGVPAREDARDALCGAASLDDLPEGASVGTSSLRRRAQLLAARPDLRVSDLRGNVDTRLRKLAEGSHDAVVLAVAGPQAPRAARKARRSTTLMTPGPRPGLPGARGAPRRRGRQPELAGRLTEPRSLVTFTAERAVVERLDATCHTPVGAYAGLTATPDPRAFVGLPDGSTWIRDAVTGPVEPVALGREVAERLLAPRARGCSAPPSDMI